MNNDILQKILLELIDIKRELRNGKQRHNAANIAFIKPLVPLEDAEIMLLGFIQRHEKVSKTAITYKLQSIGNAEAINKAIESLISKGRIERVKIGRATFYSVC